MRNKLVRGLAICCLLGGAVQAGEAKLNGHTFTLPDGFSIELAARPPLADRPICADFDEQGRLYVADSSGSNDKVEQQLVDRPHRIVRLEDTDGDGRFDKSVVFADGMMFPEGTLWHEGSLYVAAPPSIWKLTDTDGDGVADRREEWFQGKTLTHCANDLHGPYAGPDGFIYWCKGANAEQRHTLGNGRSFISQASHLFRMRPAFGRRDARQIAIVEAFHHDRRRASGTETLLHALVEVPIIELGRCPAHATDEADFTQNSISERSVQNVRSP